MTDMKTRTLNDYIANVGNVLGHHLRMNIMFDIHVTVKELHSKISSWPKSGVNLEAGTADRLLTQLADVVEGMHIPNNESSNRLIRTALTSMVILFDISPDCGKAWETQALTPERVRGWMGGYGPAAKSHPKRQCEKLLATLTNRILLAKGLMKDSDPATGHDQDESSSAPLYTSRSGAVQHPAGKTKLVMPQSPVSVFTQCSDPVPNNWSPSFAEEEHKKLKPYGYRGKASGIATGVSSTLHI